MIKENIVFSEFNLLNATVFTGSAILDKINLHLSMFMLFSVILYNFVKIWQVVKKK